MSGTASQSDDGPPAEDRARDGQEVSDSRVEGNLLQIRGVQGDVTIANAQSGRRRLTGRWATATLAAAAVAIGGAVWVRHGLMEAAPPASDPPLLLPIETDENGTVDRCVKVSGTGAPKPGYAFVVGVHLRLDEDKLRNKRTYFPSRVIRKNPDAGRPWQAMPDLAVGPAGNDTSDYDIFLGEMPEEQARILDDDLSATNAHSLDEIAARKIDIIQTKPVTRRASHANWCQG